MNFIYKYGTQLTKTTSIINLNNNVQRSFKSMISLDSLYPNSSLKLSTPVKSGNKDGQFTGYIPIDELNITCSRSSGPGGQNVNTVNTKVDLRFNVQSASWISDEVKVKLLEKYRTKITKDGFLVFRSDVTRSQQLNIADCLEKVRTIIRSVSATEPEISQETQEKIRRRQERASHERLSFKRQRSDIKTDRRSPTL